MKSNITKILIFTKLVDAHDTSSLSLTNIMIYCLLVKILMTPVLDFAAVTGLFVVVANYSYKRLIGSKVKKESQDYLKVSSETMEEIKSKVSQLEIAVGFQKNRN